MERALDVSNYSGVFGAETVACWREQGYGHIVCGTQRPEITTGQLRAALAGGMTADAYVYLYWRQPIRPQVEAALAAVAGLPIGRLWLDCEDAPAGRPAAEMVELIAAAVAACGEYPHGIYTGRWWWPPATGDSAAFSHLPLWHAEYTPGPAALPDFAAFRAYGGWTRPAIWQFQGTTYLCGVGVDLNLRDVETTPAEPVESPELSDAEREELQDLRGGQSFLQAFASGRYVFRPLADAGKVELRWRHAGESHPFEPPCIIEV